MTKTENTVQDEVSRLGAELTQILQKIDNLASGAIDSVAGSDGTFYLMPAAQTKLRHVMAMQMAFARQRAAILDALPARIAILNADGGIVSVNESWRRFAEANAMTDSASGVGRNYLAICDAACGDDSDSAREVAAGIRAVLTGASAQFSLEYHCHSPEAKHWFKLLVAPLDTQHRGGAVVMHIDVTEYRTAQIALTEAKETHLNAEKRLWSQRDALMRLAVIHAGLPEMMAQITEASAKTLGVARSSIWRFNAERTAIRCEDLYELAEDRHSFGAILDTAASPGYFQALTTSEVIAVNEATVDPRTSELSANYLIPLGITSMLDARVFVGGILDGVLCNEHTGPERHWMPDEVTFSSALASLVALALEAEERRAAEQKVYLQAAVLEATANAIVITDTQETIEWVNPAFATLTGYSRAEALGKNHRDLLRSGLHGQEFYAALWNTITSGSVWEGEIRNKRKDGTLYTEAQTITPIRDSSGKIVHFVAVKTDVTERKRLEEELNQASKMKSIGHLAGGVAHDFNNLLTVIAGYTEMAFASLKEGDGLRDDLRQVMNAANHASSLTRQLLAFSRRQLLRPKIVNLNVVISECAKMLKRLVGEDVEFIWKPDEGLWPVLADPGQIEQILMNLVVNSRDAMPLGGRIVVETYNVGLHESVSLRHTSMAAGEYVCLAVTDTGSGMDEATRNRVFEPFFTTKEQGKGTGLGLATVHGIVKQSGGEIYVYSELGKGTVFKIYLPRATESETPAETSVSEGLALYRGTETILLVEDEEPLRMLAERMLKRAGYTVLTACNGIEALALVETTDTPIHLVLTDVIMPQMGGRELVHRLCEQRREYKIIYMSGYSDTAIAAHGVLEPTVNLLSKPFTTAQLTKMVRDVLDGRLPTASG